MVQEDYVSFETAKLMKEKGFEGQCSVQQICTETCHNEDSEWTTESEVTVNIPTIQMAMRWLREVHNITIGITFSYGLISYEIQKNGEFITSVGSSRTYEQMVEEAIKYCLENLI